ncbi:MAG: RDD family protein [Candidatus Woesearchaeota archaeon]
MVKSKGSLKRASARRLGKDVEVKRRVLAVNAGFLVRGVALLVDLLLLRFTIAIPFVNKLLSFYEMAGIPVHETNSTLNSSEIFNVSQAYFESHPEVLNQFFLWLFGMFAAFWLYFSLMEFFFGQTFGKMLIKLAVIKDEKEEVRDGKSLKPSIFKCLLKNVRFLTIFPFFLIWLFDLLFLLFRKDRRTFSEVISGTKTVQYVEY